MKTIDRSASGDVQRSAAKVKVDRSKLSRRKYKFSRLPIMTWRLRAIPSQARMRVLRCIKSLSSSSNVPNFLMEGMSALHTWATAFLFRILYLEGSLGGAKR